MESSIFIVNPATHVAEPVEPAPEPVEPAPEPVAKPTPEPRKPTPPAPASSAALKFGKDPSPCVCMYFCVNVYRL